MIYLNFTRVLHEYGSGFYKRADKIGEQSKNKEKRISERKRKDERK